MDSEQDLKDKSEALKAKINAYSRQKESSLDESAAARKYRAYNEGFRMVIEFTSAIIVATAIGYFVDTKAGTLPFGLIMGVFLGFATGVYNLMRYGKRHEKGGE